MGIYKGLIVAMLAVAAAGCAPPRAQFEAGVEVMRGSPAARQKVHRECMTAAARMTAKEKADMAMALNTSPARVGSLACSRIVAGITSGRLSYDDIRDLSSGRITPKMVRLLQGRR
ncbi:hypothetical protein BL864_005439 [Escherichia coli]|nr:hypothetical protein [Escherichia coli]